MNDNNNPPVITRGILLFIWLSWLVLLSSVVVIGWLTFSVGNDGRLNVNVLGLPLLYFMCHSLITRPPWRLHEFRRKSQ